MDNELMVKTIRELCMKNNISISQLESDLEFGAGLISRWTKSSPSIDKIVDIADYFHVSLDEVVGYQNVVNDKFLEKLISQTANKTVIWNKYSDFSKDEYQPKQFSNYTSDGLYAYINTLVTVQEVNEFYESHKEISYFSKINNSYILLFGEYANNNVVNPSFIKLFIQPDSDADIIEQIYDYGDLKILWLKVLYTLGDKAPDEIKAEEFKNSFINDFKKPEPPKKKKNVTLVPNVNITSPKQYRKPPKPLTSPKSMPLVDTTKTDSKDDNKQ